ncbi:unnamed protein product [Ilex paraguariensis]|uniref:Uncharacterized protein n=1 Tax=Ilex paraguariensis TaxID=185542 RepID=A0ABC8SR94_9AQUA
MIRAVYFLLLLAFTLTSSQASSIIPRPQPRSSFKVNTTQVYVPRLDDPGSRTFERCSTDTFDVVGPCTYQVYVPRLDDPGSRTFERCSTDTFDVVGPCTYQTPQPQNSKYTETLSYSSSRIMGEVRDNEAYEEELLDYEEEDEKAPDSVNAKATGDAAKKGYVGIHSSGFRDFLLKPELLRAIVDSGFEHPSEGNNYFHIPEFGHKTGLVNISIKGSGRSFFIY